MTDSEPGLGQRMAKGSILMVLLRFFSLSIGLVSTAILARLLVPEDFGLVALAFALLAGLETLGLGGVDLVLIRDQKAGRAEYNTAWTMHILRGGAISLVLVLAAPHVTAFFDDDRLNEIFLAFAAMSFLVGFQNIGIVDFRKNLRFGPLVWLQLCSRLGALATSVSIAVVWQTYWALIAGVLVERGLQAALSYPMHPYRPAFSLQAWRKMLGFSKWIVWNNILTYLNSRVDILVLSRFTGTDILGYYSVAKRISNLATTQITFPATRSLFPGFAKIARDRDRLVGLYLSSLSLLLFIGIPGAVGVLLLGEILVPVLFGEKWLPAVPFLEILAIFGIIQSSYGNAPSVLLALGRPATLTALSAARFVVLVPLLFWGLSTAGPIGAAWAVVASAAVSLVMHSLIISRILSLPIMDVIFAVWRIIASVSAMAATVLAGQLIWPTAEGFWLLLAQLLTFLALGGGSYLLTSWGLWALSGFPDGPERHILSMVRYGLARFSARRKGAPEPTARDEPASIRWAQSGESEL